MAFISRLLALSALIMLFAAPGRAGEIDWAKAGASKVLLFYPGVTSWEFLTSDDHRLGMREIKQNRKECRHCHLSKEGELDLKADEIAAGAVKMKRSHGPFEPEPSPGKKGTLQASVQAAYDSDYLYVKVEWESRGVSWKAKPQAKYEPDRVSLQLNKTETAFRKYGCFISCHNDLNSMPSSPSKKAVSEHPYYKALGRDDVRLYAFYAKDSWSERKGRVELEKKLKEGAKIGLWSIELADANASVFEGSIFDDRIWKDKAGIEAAGNWANGRYSAVFKTKLRKKEDLSINEGDVVSAGLAIHDDNSSKRRHYVSFPFSIGIGANGDIKAARLHN